MPAGFADKRPYLWFAPEADLLESYTIEMTLANALWEGSSRDVAVVGCAGILRPRCIAITSRLGIGDIPHGEQKALCRRCRTTRDALIGAGPLQTLLLEDFVRPDDRVWAAALLSGVNKDNWAELTVNGIPVGRYASYQPLLLTKRTTISADEQVWDFYLQELDTLLRVFRGLERLFDEVRPEGALTSNQLYGTHRLFLRMAADRGLPRWSTGPGGLVQLRYGSAYIFAEETASQTMAISTAVEESMRIPLTSEEITALAAHQRGLIEGDDPWVYSSKALGLAPERTRERLNLRPDSQVVTVLMASPDEMRAAREAGADMRAAADHEALSLQGFVARCLDAARLAPEMDFVIRLHPRLFPNKREATLSPDAMAMRAMFDEAPENVHLCDPASGLSLYDNLLVSDAGINFTSSSGVEFLSWGVPVYHFDSVRLGAYPSSLGIEVKSAEELVRRLREPAEPDIALGRIRSVFRWWAAQLCRSSVLLYEGSAPSSSAEPAQAVGPSRLRSLIARLLPASVRSRLAYALELRQRGAMTLNPHAESLPRELLLQLADSPLDGPSAPELQWRPHMMLRGETLADEDLAIAAVLAEAMEYLGWAALSVEQIDSAGSPIRALARRLASRAPSTR